MPTGGSRRHAQWVQSRPRRGWPLGYMPEVDQQVMGAKKMMKIREMWKDEKAVVSAVLFTYLDSICSGQIAEMFGRTVGGSFDFLLRSINK